MARELASLLFSAEARPGFIRELVASRFVAIVLGVSALVALGLWTSWQLRILRALEREDAERPEGSESRGEP